MSHVLVKLPQYSRTIGHALWKHRISGAELARRLNVDRSTITYWLQGKRRPSESHAWDLGLIFGMQPESFRKGRLDNNVDDD